MDKRKLFLFGIVAAVIGVWLYFDLSQYFTLEQAKAQQLALQDTIHTHPVWASIVFSLLMLQSRPFLCQEQRS